MLPPQTRKHWPLMLSESGDAKNPINSATSSGKPPCFKVDNLRPPSFTKKGRFSVIFVYIKPGATAFANTDVCFSAIAFVNPITPAFVRE